MRKELPPAEFECFPDGRIYYSCPFGCDWGFWMSTPPVSGLDNHLHQSRVLISAHYRRSHGVVCDE